LNRAGIADTTIASGIHLPPRGIQIVADYVGIPQDEVPLLVMELSVKLKAKLSGVRDKSSSQAPTKRAAAPEMRSLVKETEGTISMQGRGELKQEPQGKTSVDKHNERMLDIYDTCMAYVDAVVSGDVSTSDLARIDGITKLMQAAISASAAMVPEQATLPAQISVAEKVSGPEPEEAVNDRGSQLFEKQSRFARSRSTESVGSSRARSVEPDDDAPLAFPETRSRRRFAST